MSLKVFLSVGDISAANYLYEIFREGFEDVNLIGITNEKLESIGVKSVAKISDISVVGIAEVVPKLFKIREVFKRTLLEVKKSDVLVACDAPGFNLRLIKKAKELGVKRIIYFISPQVWAWKPRRAEVIAEFADDLIVILPFEVDIYGRFESLRVHYVGHPLVDMVKPSLDKAEFLRILNLERKPVNLMPGSRWSEVKRHTDFLKEVIKKILKGKRIDFVLPTFPEFKEFIERKLSDLPVRVITSEEIPDPAYNSMFHSEISLIASGTSSLEAALALNPHVVFYRVSPITYLLGKLLVKVSFVSLPNLILGEGIVPEMINRDPKEVASEALSLLEDEKKKDRMRERFRELREKLGGGGGILKLRELFKELIFSP